MNRRGSIVLAALALLTAAPLLATEVPVTLRGSLAAMRRQHGVALESGFVFARTPAHLRLLVREGELVRLDGNEDYGFRSGVVSLYARPEMGVFIERLARDYREACDEKLVVTSLTRPATRQPPNAHRLSVHPAGIAVDLRVSRSFACRHWLENELLRMEELGILDVTREYYPPHYHVALFPAEYMAYLEPVLAAARAFDPPAPPEPADTLPAPAPERGPELPGGLFAGVAALAGFVVLRRRTIAGRA